MGKAVGISLLSCVSAEITLLPVYFRFMAAIFDFGHTQTSDSLLTSLFALSDLEIMGIALEISLLSCIEAEIYVISFLHPVNGRHL